MSRIPDPGSDSFAVYDMIGTAAQRLLSEIHCAEQAQLCMSVSVSESTNWRPLYLVALPRQQQYVGNCGSMVVLVVRHNNSHDISGFSSLTASTNSSIPPTDVGPLMPSGGMAHRGKGLT